jgi:hypothetical protein
MIFGRANPSAREDAQGIPPFNERRFPGSQSIRASDGQV